MMVADGVNGLWVASPAETRSARIASRVMGLAIAFLSLAIADLGIEILALTLR
jgi:hypothetical protein